MKISMAISVFILLSAGGLGWQNLQHLARIRNEYSELAAGATRLGAFIDPSRPGSSVRSTRRTRENKGIDSKGITAELIAWAREGDAMDQSDGAADKARQKRLTEIMDRMMSLDTAGFKTVIVSVGDTKSLTDKTRRGVIGASLMTLASTQPRAALDFFTESPGLFKGDAIAQQAVASALGKWARVDSLGALEWMRGNSREFPDLITAQAKRSLVSGIAPQDVRLAFELVAELGITDDYQAISSIMNAAKTPADRIATFNVLRECLATLPEKKEQTALADNAMNSLASTLAREGFDSSSRWVAEANFNPVEAERFSSGLLDSIKSDENDEWIGWMSKNLPPDKARSGIANLFSYWTRRDYQAAGAWLATAPTGPAKVAAVRGFAWVVSEYDPEIAMQWAMTLPPGGDRERSLQKIYQDAARRDATASRESRKTQPREVEVKESKNQNPLGTRETLE